MANPWDDTTSVQASMSAGSDVKGVLQETTNRLAVLSIAERNPEAVKLAEGKGWIKPSAIDYDAYLQKHQNGHTRREKGNEEQAEDAGSAGYTSNLHAWRSQGVRYQWKEEYGDLGARIPELEEQLFRDHFMQKIGTHMKKLDEIDASIESENKILPVLSFADAGLHPAMLGNIELAGYKVPTPIQCYTMPAVKERRDMIAIAQTGSGKTAGYLIPILSELMGKAKKLAAPRPPYKEDFDPMMDGVCAEPLVLVIVPTRELACQIFDEARRLSYRSMLRPCVAYGGGPLGQQADDLRRGCDILIGTPGRLCDFAKRNKLISLARVKYTVIDEADELVQDDWREEIDMLMTGVDNNQDADHRYMMFSATFPGPMRYLAKKHLEDDYIRIRIGRPGAALDTITQTARLTRCCYDLLMSFPAGRTIVFVNTKRAADRLDDYLYNKGMPVTSIHSDRTQREREDAIRSFRMGKCPILVATAVSARGLDIVGVMHIINYHLPSTSHGGIGEYVHRIGRTARIGNTGLATSLYNDSNSDIAEGLVKVLMECKQGVPQFLEEYKPESGELKFEDDRSDTGLDEPGDTAGASAEDGWGAGDAGGNTEGWGGAEVNAKVEKDDEKASGSQDAPIPEEEW